MQYVECLEIWTIYCMSCRWHSLKRIWNIFVIIWQELSYWLFSKASPMCVCVPLIFSAWILKRKAAHCPVQVKSQGASHTTLRLPVLSAPYGAPFPSQSDTGFTVCVKSIGPFELVVSCRPSQHPENLVELPNFPLQLGRSVWVSLCIFPQNHKTNKPLWEQIQTAFIRRSILWSCVCMTVYMCVRCIQYLCRGSQG